MRNRNTKLQLVSLPSTEFYFFKHVFSSHSFIVFLLAGVYCLSRKFFSSKSFIPAVKTFLGTACTLYSTIKQFYSVIVVNF